MFREFLVDVEVMASEIVAGFEVKDFDANPVVPNAEDIIGVVDDPWLKALLAVLRARLDTASAAHGNGLTPYDMGEEDKWDFETVALFQFVWSELHCAFKIFTRTERLELRADWTVVKVKMPPCRTGIVVIEVLGLGDPEEDNLNSDCGREDCPTCAPRRARRAERDARNKAATQA